MSKFFRSPNSSDSSSSESSDEEADLGAENGQIKEIAPVDFTSTQEVSDGSVGSDISLESLAIDRSNAANRPDWHRDFLLHALLEERCMNEVLRERKNRNLPQTPHDDREIQREAEARYQRLCAKLAPLNLVSAHLQHERHKPTRQKYRDGLDILRKGSIASAGARNSVVAPNRKLLTDIEAIPGFGAPHEVLDVPSSSNEQLMLNVLAPSHQIFLPSHYLRDFEELGVLGKGGYGTVYHVKHRLDGLKYAIKKVPIRPSVVARIQSPDGQNALEEMLLELRTLAKLEHPNVVRYFNSWIEWSTNANVSSSSDEAMAGGHIQDRNNVFSAASNHLQTSNSLRRVYTESDEHEDIGIAFESRSLQSISNAHSLSLIDSTGVLSNSATDGALWSRTEPTLALHMQMAMYPMTLQDFISPKVVTGVTPLAHCFHLEPSIALLLAIIDGVEYLHSEGMIHRDLKPANIFLRLENNSMANRGCVDLLQCPACKAEKRANPASLSVRIGDFGLVTQITQAGDVDASPRPAVGTQIYRPTGDKSSISPRLDVFALGIVAFELVYKFSTQMERRETLQALREGHFPSHFSECVEGRGSEMQEVIAAMLSDDQWNTTISFDDIRARLSLLLVGEEQG